MLRASSYNIYIELPGAQDAVLLSHGYTGAYDKVSRKLASYLKTLENHAMPKPLYGEWSDEQLGKFNCEVDSSYQPSEQTLETLKKRGYLTELEPQAEEETFIKMAKVLHRQSRNPSYILIPTYNCNLRCPYCFQDHMRTNKDFRHLLRTMQTEMFDKIAVVMDKIERDWGWTEEVAPDRRIGFFGGEPLLKISRNLIEYIITTLQKRGPAVFYAVSNGTELHHYKDLLGPGKIDMLQITLDGPPEEHDRRRIYPNGKGSFDIIADNISMALDAGVQVGVRMNIDRNNVNDLPRLANEYVKRGWHEYKNFGSYAAPIHAANDNVDKKTTFNSYELDDAIEKLRLEYPEMKFVGRPDEGLKEHAQRIFYKRNGPTLKSTFCGAHNEMFIFDAFGDIYACWELTGDKKIRIGSIKQEGEYGLEEAEYNLWRSRNVTTNPTCLKCRYALHCGGGCAIFAQRGHGTIFTNYCDAFGKRFNNIFAETYNEFASGAEYVEVQERACDL